METDPTKLTSFLPLSPVSTPSGFSIARLFSFARRDSTKSLPVKISSDGASASGVHTNSAEPFTSKDPIYSWLSNYETPLKEGDETSLDENSQSTRKERWRYRNVRTILRRLSAFTIDRRWHQTTGDFKHNFKQYWMPDEHCKECYECGDKFNTFRRRHHCRVCGQIFCYRCCGQEVAGKVIGFSGDIRVCNYCHKIVHAYLSDDMEKSIEALSEDIRVCDPHYGYEFGGSNGSINSVKSNFNIDDPIMRMKKTPSSSSLANTAERATTPGRSPFDAFGVTPIEANTIKQDYLRDLWKQMNEPGSGVELLDHRYKSKTYENCLIASDLCDWMIKTNKASNSNVAVSTGQALLENGWIEHVILTNQIAFKDEYILFRPTKMALQEMETARLRSIMFSNSDDSQESHSEANVQNNVNDDDDDDEAPKWFKQMNAVNPLETVDHLQRPTKSGTYNRGFSTGRNLDLDHVLTSTSQDVVMEEDLSLQINLNSSQQENNTNKDILDQSNKISFITHVPPLPLDSYVCVEGYQPSVRRKVAKVASSTAVPDDIMKGVVFPQPNTEQDTGVGEVEESGKDESGERLAKDRLNSAGHHHIHALLQQLLKQNNLSPTWEKIITPFLSKISEKVIPDVVRGDDMDIRRYVWITKVPGGMKSDSHLVSGVVFRKNISHKRMASVYNQPKILMMSCAIEYQRVELKMSSLDPLVLQEYAFLQNFVKRVLDVKPNILLVEKNVARVAQDMLLAGGVTLIHNIKPENMENIRRCTGAEILQKMEQVTRPKLGTCQQFRVQKYLLPSGETKTLIYLDGCAADLGCSLVLRGGNTKTLIEIKKLLRYFIYVSYHLKLEAKFLIDEFAMPPPLDRLTPQCDFFDVRSPDEKDFDDGEPSQPCKGEEVNGIENQTNESERFCLALKKIVLSSSPFCNYSVPYLLTEQGKSCPTRQYISDHIYSSNYLSPVSSFCPKSTFIEDEEESSFRSCTKNRNIMMKPAHPFTDPSVLINCVDNKNDMRTILNNFRAQGGRVDLKMYHEYEQQELQRVYGDDLGSRKASEIKEPIKDDDRKSIELKRISELKGDCFDAYNHQKIPVLFSSYSSESDNFPQPCISPWAVFMVFYGTNDITLGGFLERYCFRPSYICSDHNCDVPMVKHIRYFAHGNGSLYINMRNLDSVIPGYDRTILTWSWCKICQQVTPVVPLSLECWSLSFAKYLELRFYGKEYTRRASAEPCGHSLHHDHYQYFSFGNMVASFKYRAIYLHEIVLPSFTVTIGNQMKPQQLLDEVEEIHAKIESVAATILDRITELKSDDNGVGSTLRENKIKEFFSELQKEQCNLEDCILVVKSKVEHFLNAGDTNKDIFITSHATSFVDLDSTQDKKSNPVTNVSCEATDTCGEKVCELKRNSVDMDSEEIHVLMADIGKKLFHLKKSICESVESWNLKLQEFATQDRKKEKVLVRSVSPTKVIPASTDITEYYLDCDDSSLVDTADNRPKTITHMHPEPVSEVFLTDGTILRQTYLGTAPSSGPHFLAEQTRIQKPNESSPQVGSKLSSNALQKLDLCEEGAGIQNANADSAKEKVGSPFQEIKHVVHNDVDSVDAASKLAYENESDNKLHEINKAETLSTATNIKSSRNDEMSSLAIETIQNDCESFASDSELSLKVEYNSDRGDFSDNASLGSEEDMEFNFPESEVYSDCEMAEEESSTDTIQIGQSAVDFVNRRYARDPSSSKRRPRGVSYLSGFTEFPKIKEEPVEKIEYLTPKEAKAMQVQRRLRTEWENRIRIAIDADDVPSHVSPTHSPKGIAIKNRSSSLEASSPPPHNQLLRHNSSPGVNNSQVNRSSRSRQLNPLIKRLVQNSYETSDIEGSPNAYDLQTEERMEGHILPNQDEVQNVTDDDLPSSDLTKTNKDICQYPNAGNANITINIETCSQSVSCSKSSIRRTSGDELTLDFAKRKNIGHRRMKSAPTRFVNMGDIEVPSDLNHETPFVFVNPKQRELSKMAEQLCREERRDDERDIPEVLMFEGPNKNKVAGQNQNDTSKQANFLVEPTDPVSLAGKSKSDMDLGDQRSNVGDASSKRGSDKMKKMISNLLTSATFQPIPRPFPSWEQYLPQVGGTACIVINEKEPTSLIAFTLSSQDYADQLRVIQDVMAGKKVKRPLASNPTTSLPGSPDTRRRMDTLAVGVNKACTPSPLTQVKSASWNAALEVTKNSMEPVQSSPTSPTSAVSSMSGQPLLKSVRDHPLSSTEYDSAADAALDTDDIQSGEDLIDDGGSSVKSSVLDEAAKDNEDLSSPDFHIKLQFQNNTAKFYCSVYYAEQFRQLRELIFPEGEERYIHSLARCKFWKATGGKSGSSFSKSFDDRFVMKQMSRLEVQSFVDFSPRYFAYINKAVKEKRPTAIAKLLGVYRIGFKNSDTNTTMRQDVLVMENLFYNKKVSKIYDLKGSVRSRYVQSSTKEDVLMDENLLETICDNPLFIRPHGKAVLSKAIFNDTEFLSTNMVMDYSLLVGIDEVNLKLVVGIIDYIRTYTWDKKLESYVKSTGILGGQGKMPTVVSPDVYRLRFTAAMTQHYFLMVPDKWTGFGEDVT